MSYSGYISGVDDTFRKRGGNVVESLFRKDDRVYQIDERESNKDKLKKEPVLDLSGDNLFGAF